MPLCLDTVIGSRNSFKPCSTAFTTLIALVEPVFFERIFEIPICSMTARTGPPAIIPVPGEAGLTSV